MVSFWGLQVLETSSVGPVIVQAVMPMVEALGLCLVKVRLHQVWLLQNKGRAMLRLEFRVLQMLSGHQLKQASEGASANNHWLLA